MSDIEDIKARATTLIASGEVMLVDTPRPVYDNPFDSPEYQQFVESIAQHCRCRPPYDCPCDGVLAGGLCDCRGHEPDFTVDDLEWEEEYE